MALTSCPICEKRISDKARECPHCQAQLQGDLSSAQRIKRIEKSSQLMNHSLIAMTIFIAGVVVWFWGGEVASGTRAVVGGVLFVFGFIGYLITRVRIILNKRKQL
ncbi:zinc ribbon domain-containing protein [Shewanella sp. YIC-542]|uniref:zinc ribbon domain-containing protein n=1 Tax=Shewanella mytili TaxID=3377111 RepID=UPI00398ED2E7